MRGEVVELARISPPEAHLQRIDRIFAAREQMLEFNVPVALALESMMVGLRLARSAR
jgi:DNA polymerase-3 subunit delta'